MSTDEVIGKFELVNVNTPDGDFGFMLGTDGVFTDINGKQWFGSQLVGMSKLEYAINGKAPAGEITMAFFQDPDSPDLVQQIKSLGAEYINGRLLTFYVQPLSSIEDMYNPKVPPYKIATRVMRTIRLTASGAQNRSITLTFESAWENRRRMKRRIYNTVDHQRYIGAFDPSLEFVPTVDFEEEKLFG